MTKDASSSTPPSLETIFEDTVQLEEISKFPQEIDCFVLPETILLPRGHLSITVNEPSAIRMVDRSLQSDRLLGVVQPQYQKLSNKKLFSSGTLGRITTFIERTQKQYFILLSGLTRFEIKQEITQNRKHRRLKVSYEKFSFDGFEDKMLIQDRLKLIKLLKQYFNIHQIKTNMDDFEQASDDDLINSLTLLCPFDCQEKQALLESTTAQSRCEMMTMLMEMAVVRSTHAQLTRH